MTRRSFLKLICSVAAVAAIPVEVPTPKPPPIKPFSDRKRVLIAVDTSGSISDEELNKFMEAMKDLNLHEGVVVWESATSSAI